MSAGLRAGYKQTEVGVIPLSWEVRPLKRISPKQSVGLVINPSTYFDDRGTVPMLVGSNITENIIQWEDAKRITKASNNLISASRLATGDLVTVRVGDPGVTAVVPPDLDGCNCASVMIVRKHDAFDSHWLCSVMNSPWGRAQVANVQYGTAQKQFNISDAVNFAYPVPPLPEQRAIATVLSDVKALLAKLDEFVAKKRDLKQATMQQLLTGQTRLPGFSGEWEVKRLGELLTYEQPTKYLVSSSEYSDANDVPVLTAGKTFVLGYTNEDHGIFDNLPVIIFDDFTTANKYVTFPFKAKSSAMKLLRPRNPSVNLRLVYEMMQLVEFKLGDHKRYWISEYQKVEVKMPDAAEQTAIATVLSDMDTEVAALEARRDKTRALKQGMMQELLTGRIRLLAN